MQLDSEGQREGIDVDREQSVFFSGGRREQSVFFSGWGIVTLTGPDAEIRNMMTYPLYSHGRRHKGVLGGPDPPTF